MNATNQNPGSLINRYENNRYIHYKIHLLEVNYYFPHFLSQLHASELISVILINFGDLILEDVYIGL